MHMQAEWEEEKGQWKEATDLYLKAGDVHAAVDMICNTKGEGWQEALASGFSNQFSIDIFFAYLWNIVGITSH